MRGKEPVQIEFIPLLFGKGSPLVEKRVVQKLVATQSGFNCWQFPPLIRDLQ